MSVKKAVLDLGHSLWKGKLSTGAEVTIPHAIVAISEAQYDDAKARYKDNMPKDLIRVNGKCYAVGKSAESYGAIQRYTGARRYSEDYIGIAAMATICQLYEQTNLEVEIFASHPPTHVQYRDKLIDSIFGSNEAWHIDSGTKSYTIYVEYVNAFEEATGGLMNVMLTKDGQYYQRPELKTSKIMAIDIGGGTSDFSEMENGQINQLNPHTEPIGINKVVSDFIKSFRGRYKEETLSTMTLDPSKVRNAIVEGVFHGGGQALDCQEEAAQARNTLLNEVLRAFQSNYGGAFNYDAILLTGGGSALMYDALCEAIEHNNIMLADDLESMHLANVRGGLKLWQLMEFHGIN